MTWNDLTVLVDTENFFLTEGQKAVMETAENDDLGLFTHEARLVGGPADGQHVALPTFHGPDYYVLAMPPPQPVHKPQNNKKAVQEKTGLTSGPAFDALVKQAEHEEFSQLISLQPEKHLYALKPVLGLAAPAGVVWFYGIHQGVA